MTNFILPNFRSVLDLLLLGFIAALILGPLEKRFPAKQLEGPKRKE